MKPFLLKAPCPGQEFGSGLEYCHPFFDKSVLVRFGELRIEVLLCGHVYDGRGRPRWEAVRDALAPWYGEIRQGSDALNYKLGAYSGGWGREYRWHLCVHCMSLPPCRWRSGRRTDGDDRYSPEMFCSEVCLAKHFRMLCSECGVRASRGQDGRFGLGMWGNPDDKIERDADAKALQGFCSRECFEVHVHKVREYLKEKQCLKSLQAATRKARKALRNPDPGAWPTLKEEFDQARISRG